MECLHPAKHVAEGNPSREPIIASGWRAFSGGTKLLFQFPYDGLEISVVSIFGDVFWVLADVLEGLHCHGVLKFQRSAVYSQSTSRTTSISDPVNEMNIPIPLCYVRHLNGILKISLEIFPKKTH